MSIVYMKKHHVPFFDIEIDCRALYYKLNVFECSLKKCTYLGERFFVSVELAQTGMA